MSNGRVKCPSCGELHKLKIERRPNGNIECIQCGYSGPYVHFMSHPDRPFVRSELDCELGKECWSLTLRLATGTCYRDLKAHFEQFMNPDGSLDIGHVNLYLVRKGYSFMDMRKNDQNKEVIDGPMTVRQAIEMFKDLKVIIRSNCVLCGSDPNIHYFDNGVLYTSCTSDDIFKEEVLNVWIRI